MPKQEENVIFYKGKKYPMFSLESQRAFLEIGMVTFRFFPKDNLVITTDAFISRFKVERFYTTLSSIGDTLIAEEDRCFLYEMATRLNAGEKKIVVEVHSKAGNLFRVTLVTIKTDKDGNSEIVGGVVENIDTDTRTNALIEALGKEFGSIYYIDYKNNKTITHRVSPAIENEYGEILKLQPPYEKIIEKYIENTVLEAEKEEMRKVCAISNLKEKFLRNDVFVHDYRGIRNGKVIYCRMKVVNLSKDDDFSAFMTAFSDNTKEKLHELERMAYVDPLTGGNNYNGFKRKVRDVNKPGFILAMDIHQFKLVNTACGVAFGDKVLKEIWRVILKYCSEETIPGHINADHFVIYDPDERKEKIIDKIHNFSRELLKLSVEIRCPRIHPYFGITYWQPQKQIEEAYSETTIAKHDIKEDKETNFLFYTEEVSLKKMQEKNMEDSFAESLENGCFEVWYQPKVNPFSEKIVGAEALVRWRKENKLISPFNFISLFERTGLIRTLDEYVFGTVCNFIHNRQKKNLPNVPISVNLSRASLYYDGVVNQYTNIVADFGLSPKFVPIEITESAAATDNAVRDAVSRFKDNGFSLSVDDFGNGYSSLSILNGLKFDDLKLDKTLIDGISNANGFKLIKHTIALAKDLGMTITAEGVENRNQLESLKDLNCDYIQGYLYSKPVNQKDFEQKLSNW